LTGTHVRGSTKTSKFSGANGDPKIASRGCFVTPDSIRGLPAFHTRRKGGSRLGGRDDEGRAPTPCGGGPQLV